MKIDATTYALAWFEALNNSKKSDWDKISANLLHRLRQEGNLSLLKHIERELKDIALRESDTIQAEVTIAHDMPEKKVKELVKQLTKMDTDIEVSITKDEDLLGGLIVETKDERWDLSLKSTINQLKRKLAN